MKREYTTLSTKTLKIEFQSRILAGSVITGMSVIVPATQEQGIDIDMSDASAFNHIWE